MILSIVQTSHVRANREVTGNPRGLIKHGRDRGEPALQASLRICDLLGLGRSEKWIWQKNGRNHFHIAQKRRSFRKPPYG
jgi:hypothetical protein